jgi:hypothetical protein
MSGLKPPTYGIPDTGYRIPDTGEQNSNFSGPDQQEGSGKKPVHPAFVQSTQALGQF